MLSFLVAHGGLLLGGGCVLILIALLAACVLAPAIFRAHWELILGGVVVLVAGVVIVFLALALKETTAQLVVEKDAYATVLGQNTTLNADNNNLVTQSLLQSKSIQLVADAAQAAQTDAARALADAMAKQAGDQVSIAALEARMKDPKTNAGSCNDEITRIRAGL
jgi:hypothetical protein